MATIESITQSSDLARIARLYDRVFTGPPWFDPPLGEKRGIAYIQKELSQQLAVALLAVISDAPVGFAWGYQLNWLKFSETKYDTQEGQEKMAKFSPGLQSYFYISEVGVDPRYQKQKIGTQLAEKLSQAGSPLLMRTLDTSPMLSIAIKKLLMQPIVGLDLEKKDPENPRRVILIKQ
ncbi:hypothetical protein A2397_05600 [Candidatus Amesbacteria bacterium RIFOXYB1_FULL_44_23]|uniref:N-acetyltransferase domain-containing protein n=1 Tax=Candidatus Amesbacteria bacterium RIFOXYB1_FULL_44_23 TaxID=1797263 RepID=A0A1F4ZQU4_9BACT|nr:MAG: hypothetical protein A2397_05600 [Candidatus Amesbacteria bacterium RIFOXYB1_FULL_44_23]